MALRGGRRLQSQPSEGSPAWQVWGRQQRQGSVLTAFPRVFCQLLLVGVYLWEVAKSRRNQPAPSLTLGGASGSISSDRSVGSWLPPRVASSSISGSSGGQWASHPDVWVIPSLSALPTPSIPLQPALCMKCVEQVQISQLDLANIDARLNSPKPGCCGQDKGPRCGPKLGRKARKCSVEGISDQEDGHLQEASSTVHRPRSEHERASKGLGWMSGQPKYKIRDCPEKGFRRRRGMERTHRQWMEERGRQGAKGWPHSQRHCHFTAWLRAGLLAE